MIVPLNRDAGFDEVRWATLRKTSYDARVSFEGAPLKTALASGARLFRLVHLGDWQVFSGLWWMPQAVASELLADAAGARHGGGRLFRNYVAQYMALPAGGTQLTLAEIELTATVFAWVGRSAALFGRPGGMEQVYLPNLAERGNPRFSDYARLVHLYGLTM